MTSRFGAASRKPVCCEELSNTCRALAFCFSDTPSETISVSSAGVGGHAILVQVVHRLEEGNPEKGFGPRCALSEWIKNAAPEFGERMLSGLSLSIKPNKRAAAS
jgi:hypothetical protein